MILLFSFTRDALFAESALAPVLEELKDDIELSLHYIGVQQVRVCIGCHNVRSLLAIRHLVPMMLVRADRSVGCLCDIKR